MKKIVSLILLFIGILICSYICEYYDVTICLFHNIFHIPCPGCGLTRAIKLIMQLKVIESFQYNIIAIPVLLYILFLIFCYSYEAITKKNIFSKLFKKYKNIIIVISIILVIISWIYNLFNPLLY